MDEVADKTKKEARLKGKLLLVIPRLMAVTGLLLIVSVFAIKGAFGKCGAAF